MYLLPGIFFFSLGEFFILRRQRSQKIAVILIHMLTPVAADLLCLGLGNHRNADLHKGCAAVVAKTAFYQIIPVQLGEIICRHSIFRPNTSAVFVDIGIDLVFHLVGNAVDEVIDDFLPIVRQGIAGVVLFPGLFQPACALG